MNKLSQFRTIFTRTVLSLSLFNGNIAFASDHIDFTGANSNTRVPRELDLTDLFAWVPSPGKLTLALNTHLASSVRSKFSDNHIYRFRIRKVIMNESEIEKGTLIVPQIDSSSSEVTINCSTLSHTDLLSCSSTGGSNNFTLKTKINTDTNEISGESNDANLKLFSGLRADPFILNVNWAKLYTVESILATKAPYAPLSLPRPFERSNFSDYLNVLNITIELDTKYLFGTDVDAKYFAVAADVVKQDGNQISIIDRVGRPELTNMTIKIDEIKEAYNREDTYNLSETNKPKYKEAIRNSITGWDNLNKKLTISSDKILNYENIHDWNDSDLDKFVDILVNDFLVVNLSGSCTVTKEGKSEYLTSYLDLETNRKENGTFRSCGGRTPTEDIIDTLVSYYVAGPKASNKTFGDGADSILTPPTTTWPYFSKPSLAGKN